VIGDREVEVAFLGLDLVPRNRHEDGIEVQMSQARQDRIGFRGGAGGGVAQLAAENEVWLAVYEKLGSSIVDAHGGEVGLREDGDREENSCAEKGCDLHRFGG